MDDNADDNYDDDDGYEDDANNDGDDTDVGRCWEDWLPSSCCLLIAGCRRHTTYICICNWKSCICIFWFATEERTRPIVFCFCL